jgi:nucleotide-binding universal stress UspA family protein
MFPFHAILHPTDFSEPAHLAFRLACRLARSAGARLVVAHVLEPPLTILDLEAMTLPTHESREERGERLWQIEADDPAVRLEHRLLEGDPATEIVGLARRLGCDLIVMGAHGTSVLARLLLGSVAERVMRQAPCPVLTVKVPDSPSPIAPGGPARAATATPRRGRE